MHLTLCGATNMKDHDVLFPDSKLSKDALNSGLKLSDDKTIALDQLAKKRQVDIKTDLAHHQTEGVLE